MKLVSEYTLTLEITNVSEYTLTFATTGDKFNNIGFGKKITILFFSVKSTTTIIII